MINRGVLIDEMNMSDLPEGTDLEKIFIERIDESVNAGKKRDQN
jgi:hypothetical protein